MLHPRLRRVLCPLVLLCLSLAACSEPAPRLEGPAEEPPRALAFTDVTAEAGLGDFAHETGALGQEWFPETVGSGGAFVDYDGDGHLDVLLVGGGTWPEHTGPRPPALRLYRSEGDGTFTEVTEEAGLADVHAYGLGLSAADYDDDGDEDFFLTTLEENLLFRNDGGTFTEVGREAGIADHAAWSSSAIFFDADRDGDPDLYVGNYVKWSPEEDIWCTIDGETKSYCTPQAYEGVPGRFYRNEGDGTFAEATEEAGFGGGPGKTLGVAELDYNHDGWPDLVVANDTQRDLLYRNRGDGTFEEVGVISGIAYDENGRARAGMGIDAADVDNRGEPSIFIGHFSNEMIGVYRHVGRGLFVDRAAVSKIGRPSLMTLTFGLFLFDADLDGYLDLFVANGHIAEEIEATQDGITYRQPAQLFLNRRDGTFEEVSDRSGSAFAQRMVARGAAYGDYDRDGDLDVLLTENGGPAHLWRNDLAGGRSLRVRLEGTRSSREGLGARVVAVAGDHRMERRVRTGSSYLSQSEKTVTFGLGTAAQVDSLLVYWPSGQVDRLAGIAAGQELHLVEGGEAPLLSSKFKVL